MKKSLVSVLLLLIAAVVFVALPTPAHASYDVQVYDDGVLQSGITVLVSGNSLIFLGSTTHFSITNGSGLSNNPGGSSTNLDLSNNEQVNATFGAAGGTHTIQIILSQTDFTSPTGTPLSLSSSAGGSFAYVAGTTAGASECVVSTYQGFLDTTNTLFGQPAGGSTPLQTSNNACGTSVQTIALGYTPSTSTSLVPGGTPFSMTDVLSFTFTLAPGSGQASTNASVSTVAMARPVPEPASLMLLGTGLLVLAKFTRRRRS